MTLKECPATKNRKLEIGNRKLETLLPTLHHGIDFIFQGSGHEGPDRIPGRLLFIDNTIYLFHYRHFHP
jgi:hypothetical protein